MADRGEAEQQLSRRSFLSTGLAFLGTAPLLQLGCASTPTADTGPDVAREIGYVYDEGCLDHPHTTERPERLVAIHQRLSQAGLVQQLTAAGAVADPYPHIAKIHSAEHISAIKQIPKTGPAAGLAVAGVLGAVKAVCEGRLRAAFCAIRPPGHHAHNSGTEEGFCFYGNVAVAARYAQLAFGVKRVLIVDWDYHHGNGTEWAFYDDPTVLFFSTHNWHAYPGTGDPQRQGAGAGLGYNINVHLDPGAGDDAFRRAFDEHLLPAASAFKPELVLVSAGFDSKRDDQLGEFDLTPGGFAALTADVTEIARTHAAGRLVSVLEGGYADRGSSYTYHGLAQSVEAHVRALVSGSGS